MGLTLERGFVGTASEYYDKHDMEMNWDDKKEIEKYESINNIIALQVAEYIGRRTAGCDGSINDHFMEKCIKAKQQHQEVYGEEYIDDNRSLI